MKLDIQPINKFPWEEDNELDIQPLDIQPLPEELPTGKKLKAGVKQSFAGVGNTVDTALSLAASLPASLFSGKEAQEDIFKNLNQRISSRKQWAGTEDPGFIGKLAGVGATLPMQLLSYPLGPVDTGKTFIDQGESLGRALAATGIDAAGTAVGVALPAALPLKSIFGRAVTGAGINALQDTATRAGISALAEKQSTKDLVGPSLENAAISAIIGGGFGAALVKPKSKNKPVNTVPLKKLDDLEKEEAIQRLVNELEKEAKSGQRDEATISRLEAAVAKQNPRQGEIRVGKDGDAYFTSPETEYARNAAEAKMLRENEEAYADPFARIARELTPEETPNTPRQPVDPMQEMQRVLELERYKQAQAQIEARQRALEEEMARNASLSRNAVQRQNQEQAPTGYSQWVDAQRSAAEQRLPGNNTPLDFNAENAPYSYGNVPYQYPGGLDFVSFKADLESANIQRTEQEQAAWKQRQQEQLIEDTVARKAEELKEAQEGALQPLEERLRSRAYRPTGDGQGPKTRAAKAAQNKAKGGQYGPRSQRGGIDPQVINDFIKVGQALKRAIERKFGISNEIDPDVDIDWATGEPYTVLQWAKSYDEHKNLIDGSGINPFDDRYQKAKSTEEAAKLYERDIAEKYNLEDEYAAKHALDKFRINRFGQGGGIDPDLLTFGFSRLLKNKRKENTSNKQEIFAGTNAFSAPYSKLKLANEAALRGVAPDDIWNEYGWVKGGDGRWRFELDDSQLYVKPEGIAKLSDKHTGEGKTIKLEDLIDHPKLFENYPQLRKLQVEVSAKDVGEAVAHYDPNSKKIRFSKDLSYWARFRTKDWTISEAREFLSQPEQIDLWTQGESPERKKQIFQAMQDDPFAYIYEISNPDRNLRELDQAFTKTLIHEIQHAVQDIEGFQGGYNWRNDKGEIDYQEWLKTHGEIEAEESAQRLRYSEEDRRWDLPLQATKEDDVLLGKSYPVLEHRKKFGQGGSAPIISDLAQGLVNLGRGIRAKIGVKPPEPDTVVEPRSPENIAAKKEKAAKAKAIGLGNDSIYGSVNTLEEVKSYPAKDLGRITQQASPGMEAVLRRNTQNKLLQWVRTLQTKAETATNKYLRDFVTGDGAFNDTFGKLNEDEIVLAHQLALKLDELGRDYTPELGQQLEVPQKVNDFLLSRQRMTDGEFTLGQQVAKNLGLDYHDRRKGYARSNFDTAYTALVGYYKKNKDGSERFVPYTVINANTRNEYKAGLAWWEQHKKEKGLSNYVVKRMDREGLNSETSGKYGRPFDPLARLLSELAKLNPDFAEAKKAVDEAIKGHTRKLGRYDLHSLEKMGVGGAIGRKPWLDAKENAKAFFRSEVDSFDQGFKYWNYQDMLNKMGEAQSDPFIVQNYPNTVKYLELYRQNIQGSGLNKLGALLNAGIDAAFAAAGRGSSMAPRRTFAAIRQAMSYHMMGIWNPTFMGIQMMQYPVATVPEAMRIAKDFDIGAVEAGLKTLGHLFIMRPWMEWTFARHGNLDKLPIAQELKDGFKWMKEHGLTDYNEVVQSHDANKSKTAKTIEEVAGHPMTIPERLTRPTAFLAYVDLMKGKLQGDELFFAAKRAADYAMTNYQHDEAPLMYNRTGVIGENVGGLKKFVHNAVDQNILRTKEAFKYPAAFGAAVGMTLALQGITGIVGYATADQISQALTDEPLRYWLEKLISDSDTKKGNALLDGFLSAYSEVDYQTRFSLADVIPDNAGETIAGPHLMKLGSILTAGYNYATDPSQQTFNQFARQATPSGLAGLTEDALFMKDGFVLDKEGQVKYEQPRSEKEQAVRKYTNLRPLRERLEDEDLFVARKMEAKQNQDQRDASKKMKAAINFGDAEGFKVAQQEWLDAGGDPKRLNKMIEQWAKDARTSARMRASGVPSNTPASVNKYKHYWEE